MNVGPVTIGGVTWNYGPGSYSAWPKMTPGIKVTGKSGVNTQFSGDGRDTMIGGGGKSNNIFYVGSDDTAIAGATDNIDTIIGYWGNLTLPAGFTVGETSGPATLTGNNLNDILVAEAGYAQTIVGGSGDDLMVGASTGQDRFVIGTNGGSAAIQNFIHGSDIVELNNASQFDAGFLAVKAAMSQVGANVVLNLGNGRSVTFQNQTVAQFTAADFALPFTTAGLTQTFNDQFASLSASANGVGTTWQYIGAAFNTPSWASSFVTASGPGTPFSDTNGALDITAAPTSALPGASYTSGGLTTAASFAQTYGYFEINAELPAGAGMWPAFWLLPLNHDGTEIDSPEVLGNDPNTIYLSAHSTPANYTTLAVQGPNTSTGFHTYGVDWEPTTITYYLDGNDVGSIPTPADMDTPMYMLLDLAVGTAGSWSGAATGETGQLLVNWVQVFATANTIPAGLVLIGAGDTISRGDGTYTVTGTGYAGTVALGNGNQSVQLTGAAGTLEGSENTIETGNGNDTITTIGDWNDVTTGTGNSIINAGDSYNTVLVGGTAGGGTTLLTASGSNNSFTATAPGNMTVSDPGGGTTISLGDGNQTINLGGQYNTITLGSGTSVINAGTGDASVTIGSTPAGITTISASGYFNIFKSTGPGNVSVTEPTGSTTVSLGNGNQVVTLGGRYNHIRLGNGASVVNAGSGQSTVSVGATPTGQVTTLSATGNGNSFVSTGAGNVNVTEAAGGTKVSLGAGNDKITLGGVGNVVTVGAGNSVIRGGSGSDTITTGAGNSTITVTGTGNILSAGAGNNTLNGGSGHDVFFLNAAGQGRDTITGFTTKNSDLLDLTAAIKALGAVVTSADFAKYITSTVSSAGTELSIDPSGKGGTGQEIAMLSGIKTTVAALISSNSIRVGGTIY